MIKTIFDYTQEQQLFESEDTQTGSSFFQTVDAKSVYRKVHRKICSYFTFSQSQKLLGFDKKKMSFLLELVDIPQMDAFEDAMKQTFKWNLPYDFVVVTEDETFYQKHKQHLPIILLYHKNQIADLSSYDRIYIYGCDLFSYDLECLPQSSEISHLPPEYYLTVVAKEYPLIQSMLHHRNYFEKELGITKDFFDQLTILDTIFQTPCTLQDPLEKSLLVIEDEIQSLLAKTQINASELYQAMQQNDLPADLKQRVHDLLTDRDIPHDIFTSLLPVKIDEQKLQEKKMEIRQKQLQSFFDLINQPLDFCQNIMQKIKQILYVVDFAKGMQTYTKEFNAAFARSSSHFSMKQSLNILIAKAQPISYHLEDTHAVLLTGANSGGKTTLLEHIIQLLVLDSWNLPVSGDVTLPSYGCVYYFSKPKGGTSKGAFEQTLQKFAKIQDAKKALILIDELEAVTEPRAASRIIASVLSFFSQKNTLIAASHLGFEIIPHTDETVRVDGIEATGLSEDNELIVDHNPVIGRIANSAPQLIIEKLAQNNDRFYTYMKQNFKNSIDSA